MINTINLPPFKKMCITIGNLPSSFVESMSYYEALCWLVNFLANEVVPAVNTNSEAITELQTYVANYFDNLDVQEEINNKLDAMAEAGTLQEIVAEYLNTKAVFGFDSVDDMKDATNLIDGSYARTLGFAEINDGGAALYKIRNITNDDVIDNVTIIPLNDEENNLIAELIIEYEMNSKCFNIIGDGVTDDTDALQHALNITNIICNKNETYKITKTMYINHSLNGNNSTFIVPNYSDLTIESYRGIYIVNQKNIVVKNCKFIGSYTDYTQKIPYTTTNILPPILSYMDGSDNSQCIGCHFEKTNGHSVIVYGNTVNNILIENCTAIDCGCGVGIEKISGGAETPKNITINNFYSECNNSCEITSGSGISVNNCYFECNGKGKGIITSNEAYHDTHVDINGCTFKHSGVGASATDTKCIFIDSYNNVKKMYVNLTGCVIDADIADVTAIYINPNAKVSLISCEIKGRTHVINGSYLDIINCSIENKVASGNVIVVNNANSYCSISNSKIEISSPGNSIWTQGNLDVTNSVIESDDVSIKYKSGVKGVILNSTISKLDTSETPYGIIKLNTILTNDTRFLTDIGTILGTVSAASDLANLPASLPNCSMILVTGTKKIAYKYGSQWFYADGTYISG